MKWLPLLAAWVLIAGAAYGHTGRSGTGLAKNADGKKGCYSNRQYSPLF